MIFEYISSQEQNQKQGNQRNTHIKICPVISDDWRDDQKQVQDNEIGIDNLIKWW